MVDTYPFVVFCYYIQYLFVYLTFRIKYCPRLTIDGAFRVHLVIFVYSIFMLCLGWIDIIQSFGGRGYVEEDPAYLFMSLFVMFLAHLVCIVYTCYPKYAIGNEETR